MIGGIDEEFARYLKSDNLLALPPDVAMGRIQEPTKPLKRPRGRPRGSAKPRVRREVPGRYPCKHCGEILSSPAYKYTCPVSFADGVLGVSSSQKEMP